LRAFVHYNSRNDWGLLELLPEPVKQALEVVNGDVQDPFFVRKAVSGCTVVFHLASPASLHPRTARVPVPLIRPWASGSAT